MVPLMALACAASVFVDIRSIFLSLLGLPELLFVSLQFISIQDGRCLPSMNDACVLLEP
jgi:hypothetical protein